MPNKMLIDATHPEETRVVVLHGNRVEEFDFKSANRKQLRGNIYLAKVTRVEPSLQAAFVEYGGNRHGFLAFSEIHPDYYQIPVADRQALIEEEERAQRQADDDADHRAGGGSGRRGGRRRHRQRGADRNSRDVVRSEPVAAEGATDEASEISGGEQTGETPIDQFAETAATTEAESISAAPEAEEHEHESADAADEASASEPVSNVEEVGGDDADEDDEDDEDGDEDEHEADAEASEQSASAPGENGSREEQAEEEHVESVGGADALEEVQERVHRVRPRQYKIQEVIKRRQVMLVQVVKEERGSKGAALTTYLSLAGRYSVLMPNTARGGGISRKITSSEDRNRLKEIAQDLEVPDGMGVILRTAGAARTKLEVKRDFEYLLRLWETVRDLTLKSTAPMLVYEEGSLTKRSIRDLYNKDIDEVIVAGDEGYKDAKDFMRMLMPSHAKNVKPYKDPQPIFTRFNIESQLDAMFSPVVQLRSGGYIVINQTEALVAIDVNSGRATREHHIEDTALKTNLEASEEVARQLRLRDLAGLIVIDYIDMDEGRNNRAVERRLKECLKHDRARIQVGRISHFGLMEMSRQRIRTSVLESSTEKCPSCGGTGYVRSVSSVSLQLLRGLEEMLLKGATHNLMARTRAEVALYLLNSKRAHLRRLEERFQITITVVADASIMAPQSFVIDRGEQVHTLEAAKTLLAAQYASTPIIEEEDDIVDAELDEALESEGSYGDAAHHHHHDGEHPHDGEHEHTHAPAEREGAPEGGRKRRRRRRGGRAHGGEGRDAPPANGEMPPSPAPAYAAAEGDDAGDDEGDAPRSADAQSPGNGNAEGEGGRRRRRRGRRGGRRNRHRNGDAPGESNGAPQNGGHDGDALAVETFTQPTREFEQPAPVSRQATPAYSEQQFERPAPVPPAPVPVSAPAAAASSEPPRRRSTIREPASFGAAPATAAPLPKPVISSTAPEATPESGEPKRGWWGKRIMGDK